MSRRISEGTGAGLELVPSSTPTLMATAAWESGHASLLPARRKIEQAGAPYLIRTRLSLFLSHGWVGNSSLWALFALQPTAVALKTRLEKHDYSEHILGRPQVARALGK